VETFTGARGKERGKSKRGETLKGKKEEKRPYEFTPEWGEEKLLTTKRKEKGYTRHRAWGRGNRVQLNFTLRTICKRETSPG